MKNPLDGVTVNQPTRVGEHGLPKEASGMFQYFLKVGQGGFGDQGEQ